MAEAEGGGGRRGGEIYRELTRAAEGARGRWRRRAAGVAEGRRRRWRALEGVEGGRAAGEAAAARWRLRQTLTAGSIEALPLSQPIPPRFDQPPSRTVPT
jgi:hypothetical protein